MNFHSSIRLNYGKDCLDNIRCLEKTGQKIARYRNHLRFSLHCKHQSITPVSLRLSSTVKGNKANNILRRAEKGLLNVRVGQIVNKLDRLDGDKQRLNDIISNTSGLPDEVISEVRSRTSTSQLKAHELSKTRQRSKFATLVAKQRTSENKNIASECIDKWVKNCSKRLLNDPELCVLAKGLNFAVAPSKAPVAEFITTTESACRNLPDREANELRSKVTSLLSKSRKIDSNLNKEETKALERLRKDKDIRILPADKGKLVVVLDTEEYHKKCESLLSDTSTYKKLGKRDPTSKYKKELVTVLQRIQFAGAIDNPKYRHLYPTTECSPKFYGLPKVHKKDIPLRPIVSSVNTITYNSAKFLADILSPLVGNTEHHIINSKHFSEKVRSERVEDDEELRSYDVSALFTSVPVDRALVIIRERLENDKTLGERTKLTPQLQ